MEILTYGEDGLTLWALTCRLGTVLKELGDDSDPGLCRVFYRPSFGRAGGEESPQFGEFDFIVLSQCCLYLGESKWDQFSKRFRPKTIHLDKEQEDRHRMLGVYIRQWVCDKRAGRAEFVEQVRPSGTKPLAPAHSLLAANLQTLLGMVETSLGANPSVRNVLMYFHYGNATKPTCEACEGFELLPMDYSGATLGKYVRLEV